MWRKTGRALRTLILGFLPLILMLALVLRAAHQEVSAPLSSSPDSAPTARPQAYSEVQFNFGRGYIGAGWRLYFNEPEASADRESYEGGIEIALSRRSMRRGTASISPLLN